MIDYDPDVDVTAGELRSCGMPVDTTIPDCAWIPRAGIRWSTVVGDANNDAIDVTMCAEFTMPFRWIELTGTIEDKPCSGR